VNGTFADARLGVEHVTSAWAGLRPLLHQEGKNPSEISRRDEVMVSPSGLISVAGGKLTTYRRMAERVVNLVGRILGEKFAMGSLGRPRTADLPLSGGELGEGVGFDDFCAQTERAARSLGLPAEVGERIARIYGAQAHEVFALVTSADVDLWEGFLTRAEIVHALEEEMVLTVEDFLDRRISASLFTTDNGLGVLERVAGIMASHLGWSEGRRQAEVGAYRILVRDAKAFGRR
jgi:glycerol-3-phosphate dehydrogenase